MIHAQPKMPDRNERRQFWKLFMENTALRNLLDDVLCEAVEESDTVVGVKPEDLPRKQGLVQGLQMAREILQRKEIK